MDKSNAAKTFQELHEVLCVAEMEQKKNTQAPDDTEYLTGGKLYALVIALLLVVLIMTLDMSILATAIPRITDDFDTVGDIGWYGAAFSISCAALQPLSGKIYTYFSIKYSFLLFIAIFELGSLLSGAAVSSDMLIIGRAISGIGGSGVINGALTIVGICASPEKRPVMMGIVMSFAAAGQLMGPLVGGALTEHVSRRWCFYINLPAGGLTMLFIFFIHVPVNNAQNTDWTMKSLLHDLDIAGFTIFGPACIMLLLALEWAGTSYAWDSATIIGLLCGSAAVFFLFLLWERRQGESAMVPLSVIGRRAVYSGCLTTFFQGGGMLLLAYWLPAWFQVVKKADPTSSAVHTLPTFISQIVFAVISGILGPRLGYLAPIAMLGNVLATVGSGLMSTFTPTTGRGEWIGYQVLSGAGRGLTMQIVRPMISHCHPFLPPYTTLPSLHDCQG